MGITITGQDIYPNSIGGNDESQCNLDSCNEHIGQGGGGEALISSLAFYLAPCRCRLVIATTEKLADIGPHLSICRAPPTWRPF